MLVYLRHFFVNNRKHKSNVYIELFTSSIRDFNTASYLHGVTIDVRCMSETANDVNHRLSVELILSAISLLHEHFHFKLCRETLFGMP